MNPEDYVSYPIALALKKAGFDWECDRFWCKYFTNSDEMRMYQASADDFNNDDWDVPHCSAPTLWQAQKWLRDIFLLHVGANPALPTRKWQFYIDDLNQQINPYDGELMTRWDDDMQEKADEHLHDTYESALSAGIAVALELIEKKGE